MLAGGVESMSRAPYVVEKSTRPFPAGNQTMWNTSIGWRIVNPRLPKEWTISNGESAEKLAGIHRISREEQDAFAARSHRLAARAWADGIFDREIVQVDGHHLARDESIRDESTVEVLAGQRPAFAANDTVTAASGGRIIGHAAHELARRGSGIAVAAICIGVGQGLAVVLER